MRSDLGVLIDNDLDAVREHHRATALTLVIRLARVVGELRTDPSTWPVIKAFGLENLLDDDFIQKVHGEISGYEAPALHFHQFQAELKAVIRSGHTIRSLVLPLGTVRKLKSKDVLSLEVHWKEDMPLLTQTLADTTCALTNLYEAFCTVASPKEQGRELTLLKIESGSSLRIDCTGIADIVKEVKRFLIDLWNRIDHRESERLRERLKAAADGVEVVSQIHKLEKNNEISPEQAEQLKRRILGATETLFESRALPPEIHAVQLETGYPLLTTKATKLLAEPSVEE